MKVSLTCPVCNHPEITENICPNCETDLTLLRMLAELPDSENTIKSTQNQVFNHQFRLPIYRGILILLLGICLGISGNLIYDQLPKSNIVNNSVFQPSTTLVIPALPTPKPEKIEEKINACSGNFYYKVRTGDYLWLIAENIYGDGTLYTKIAAANPSLKDRNNNLIEGEVLTVPNLQENCRGNI